MTSNIPNFPFHNKKLYIRQVSNIRRTLVGNEIGDHSDVVGASPVGAAPNISSFSTKLTPAFIGLGKDNCKTRRETFEFGDLVRLILEILRYVTNDLSWSTHRSDVVLISFISPAWCTGNSTLQID